MKTVYGVPRLEVNDLEFVVARPYAARHECGAVIIGRGGDMRERMNEHTRDCTAAPSE